MHSLEQILVILSHRIRHETGNKDLADETMHLASASHDYETSRPPDPLTEMCEDWMRRFYH
jgi:hypothetical protein